MPIPEDPASHLANPNRADELSGVPKAEQPNSSDGREHFFGYRRILRILGPNAAYYLARVFGPSVIGIRRFIAARGIRRRPYHSWIRTYERILPDERLLIANEIDAWPSRPVISVITSVYNVQLDRLRETIESVRKQFYPHWQLCISDDASTYDRIQPLLRQYAAQDRRIRVTFRGERGQVSVNSNSALELADGDYIALLDAGDRLSNDALFWAAREIALHPDADLLFSDEDKIDAKGERFDPYFKPAWNPALMLSQNAFSHLGIFRRRLIKQVGQFRQGYEGSQDYDLVLRCSAKTTWDRIRHIPRILYHHRNPTDSTAHTTSAKSGAWERGRLAVADFLQCQGTQAEVRCALKRYYLVDYRAPQSPPLVSIIVPSTLSDRSADCLGSVLSKSTYQNLELLVVVRTNHLAIAKTKLGFVQILSDPRLRIVFHEEASFNFSRATNLGARLAHGSILCFLNDDVTVITPDWLERLVARVLLDGVGAVGPMLYYPDNVIQHAGMILGIGGMTDHVFARHRRGYLGYFGRAALEQDYSCLTAACLLVKRALFEEVGGLDEAFPIAFNDVDLCMKIRRTGARIVWIPSVEMYHHESATTGRHDAGPLRQQYLHDLAVVRDRWKGALEADPCYNPNLSLKGGSTFTLAWPPRTPALTTILKSHGKLGISRTSELPS